MEFVMPSGLHRTYGAHHLYFITTCCYRRRSLLQSARARDRFLSILEETRQQYRFVVVGYVIMPEHVHLLLNEPEVGTPSTVMQVLKQRTARALLPRRSGGIGGSANCSARNRGGRSARRVLTTSTYGARRSGWKSCATCIAIR